MTQLKVGDRVRRISCDNSYDMLVGDTGVVRSVEGDRVQVASDRSRRALINLAFNLEKIEDPVKDDDPVKTVPTFKVGDYITCWGWPKSGLKIKKIVNNVADVELGRNQPALKCNLCSGVYSLVLRPPAATAIVALITNGVPKPSFAPRVHASEQDAKDEAQRLANKHRSREFGVFVLSSTAKNDKPVYEHNWQTLAADGKTIDAIKELRRITGLGLRTTKEAVESWLSSKAA